MVGLHSVKKRGLVMTRVGGIVCHGIFLLSRWEQGGQFLTEFAPLCRITTTGGEEYTIFSCIRGRLLEVNEDILKRPNLLTEKPYSDGYIAVILPKFEESKSITEGLLTRAEYEDVVLKRTAKNEETLR